MQVVQSGRSSQLYECTVHRPACLRLLAARTLRSARNCYALIADCCVPVETARVVYASAFRMLNEYSAVKCEYQSVDFLWTTLYLSLLQNGIGGQLKSYCLHYISVPFRNQFNSNFLFPLTNSYKYAKSLNNTKILTFIPQ